MMLSAITAGCAAFYLMLALSADATAQEAASAQQARDLGAAAVERLSDAIPGPVFQVA